MKTIVAKGFPIAFYASLIIFLALYVRSLDWTQLRDVEFSWPYLLVATVFALTFRYWGAIIWLFILRSLGAKDLYRQVRQLFYVYAKSWLGRYIPGTAPWIIGKIYFASKLGISKNKLAVSSMLEGGLQIIVTLVIAFIILAFDSRLDVIDTSYKLIMLGIAIAGIVAIIPAVFNRLMAIAYRIIKKKQFAAEHNATPKTVLGATGLYIIGSFFTGLSFFFIAKSIYPDLAYNDLLFVLGASNLASAVSMLAIFAPSGIGVREGIQVVLLSIIMPIEIAILIAVVTRLWSVVIDLLFYGLTLASRRGV